MGEIFGNKGFRLGLTLFGIGLIAFIVGFKDWFSLKHNAINLNTIQAAECKEGKYLTGEIKETLGCYCEEEHKENGVVKYTNRYYLITFGEQDDMLISIKVSESDYDDYEALFDSTMAYFEGESDNIAPLGNISGKLKKCDAELEGYLKEYLGEEFVDAYVPYYISQISPSSCGTIMKIGAVVGGIGLVILILFFIALAEARRPLARTINTQEQIDQSNDNLFGNE